MKRVVKKASERREEIITAAREHFQTQDFQKITMKILMEKLNIAKGTIYHHFASKGEILEAVVEDMVEEELVRKLEVLKNNKKLKPIEKLTLLITESNRVEGNEKLLENLHHPDNAAIHARQLALIILKVGPLFASVIEEGCKAGIFTTETPLESAELLLGGLQFLTDEGFYPWQGKDLGRRVGAIPSLMENLLGAPKGSFDFMTQN